MTIDLQLQAQIDLVIPETQTFKVADIGTVTTILEKETRSGGRADPALFGYEAWDCVGQRIPSFAAPAELRGAVEFFYLAWWNAMTRYQLENPTAGPQSCHRGSAGYALAFNRWAGGDHGSALRWCLLAHLADRLQGGYDAAAAMMLVATLGVPQATVDQISEIASRRDGEPAEAAARWSESMPELLLLRLIRGNQFSALLRDTPRREHELAPAIYAKLRAEAEMGSGSDLELLAAYLVSLLPGYRLRQNTLAKGYAYENDVVAALTPYARPVFSDRPSSILIECKNWRTERLGSTIVGYFYSRMIVSGCRVGILVSQRGVTSMERAPDLSREERAGEAMIRRLFHETGSVVLSLDATELGRVGTYGSFVQVLQERYEDFMFGSEI